MLHLIQVCQPDATARIYNPFGTWQNEIQRLFDTSLGGSGERSRETPSWVPPLDLAEDKDHFIVTLDLPGVKREDVKITLHEDVLTISGQRAPAETSPERAVYRQERRYGPFERKVQLTKPVKAEAIAARQQEGLLTLTLPKPEAAKPRQITVSAA